eukprot:TRINITY_DN42866_c0_g1_i1.p1 TRINITY_DN42866_c0_g1~~TRINITY_DN42866_c0_g1_i1.p1  ORF type:complete len:486 (-),score=49.76 TRINITY_DN42866_c0_g1_i1:99-1556(-)
MISRCVCLVLVANIVCITQRRAAAFDVSNGSDGLPRHGKRKSSRHKLPARLDDGDIHGQADSHHGRVHMKRPRRMKFVRGAATNVIVEVGSDARSNASHEQMRHQLSPQSPYGPSLFELKNVCASTAAYDGTVELFGFEKNAPDKCDTCLNQETYTSWSPCGIFFARFGFARSIGQLQSCLQTQRIETWATGAEMFVEPTLLITTHSNIGHILHDIIASIYRLKSQPWTRVWIPPSPKCSRGDAWGKWGCPVLKALGLLKTKALLRPRPVGLFCFERLLLPAIALNRNFNNMEFADEETQRRWVLQIRDTLVKRFVRPKLGLEVPSFVRLESPRARRLLTYGHRNADESRWLDYETTATGLQQLLPGWTVLTVASAGEISIQRQATLWHEADIVMGPSGAEAVNGIFSRNGSVHIELKCPLDIKHNWGNMAFLFGWRRRLIVPIEKCSLEGVRPSAPWLAKSLLQEILNFDGPEPLQPSDDDFHP